MTSRFRSAVFLQFLGTVGSGIFVLPYLFARSNYIFASVFLIFLTVVTAVLNHFYVKIITSTRGDHQLTGYTEIYLGPKFKSLASLNLILLSFGAILAYSKLFTSFTQLLFPSLPLFLISTIFILTAFLIFHFRTLLSKNLFVVIPIFVILTPILLLIFSLQVPSNIGYWNLHIPPAFSFFGATLFALSGFTIIPEVRETLGSNARLSTAVLLGLILSATLYLIYTFSVIRLSGDSLSIDSVTGLSVALPYFAKVMAVFGMVITLRSTANFLIILRELFYRDLKITKTISDYLPLLFPVVALSLRTVSLISIISLTGHFTILISALIICLIRIRQSNTFATLFWSILIILTLILGLVINLFN